MRIQRGSHAFRRQFELGGIIRLGGERSRGEWNQELSYFRLTDAPRLVEHYGEKPTLLHVMLPDEDPEIVFEDAYELWRGSKKENVKGVLLCRGNGEICERLVDEDHPWERDEMPCPTPPECVLAREKTTEKVARETGNPGAACGAVGRLRVICYRVNVMEVYEIRTGSINAFQGLRNQLENLKQSPIFGGRLTGIPFILERVPKTNKFGGTNYPVKLRVPTWKEMEKELGYLGAIVRKVQSVVSGAQLPPPPDPHRPLLPEPGAPGSVPDDLVAKTHLLPPAPTTTVERVPEEPRFPRSRQVVEMPPGELSPEEEQAMLDVISTPDERASDRERKGLPPEEPTPTPAPAPKTPTPKTPAPAPKRRGLLG
uniref:Uncharacterized protein n=1 Tax=viral metagenome TaxID=1070528 RepID=A0A6M3IJV4_9ZZZZ